MTDTPEPVDYSAKTDDELLDLMGSPLRKVFVAARDEADAARVEWGCRYMLRADAERMIGHARRDVMEGVSAFGGGGAGGASPGGGAAFVAWKPEQFVNLKSADEVTTTETVELDETYDLPGVWIPANLAPGISVSVQVTNLAGVLDPGDDL